jgi:hypothetical protein
LPQLPSGFTAQAAKTARIAWALLCSGENYRGRTAAA